ncbi:asparaginyl-tRNA synthetase [Trypanosoma rangeli SC58]|uniref:asparagine--tRNA ligase n=1 Tax=Trypanosoma rangeli SC58 TaxID=429131 RepID=A0A061IZT9_TRYRA|nr:asparaginyl-tRNA synthetase [Trypanosoma rangeli SC58]
MRSEFIAMALRRFVERRLAPPPHGCRSFCCARFSGPEPQRLRVTCGGLRGFMSWQSSPHGSCFCTALSSFRVFIHSPDKTNMTSPAELIERLQRVVGLDEKNSKDLSTKPERVQDLLGFFASQNMTPESPREQKVMLFNVWTKVKLPKHRALVAEYVKQNKLDSTQKVDAAIRVVNAMTEDTPFDAAAFEKDCGVGVEVSHDEILRRVKAALADEDPKALKVSWMKNPNMLLGRMKQISGLQWADFIVVKTVLEELVPPMIKDVVIDEAGPKTKEKAPTQASKKSDETAATNKCPRGADWKSIVNLRSLTRIGDLPSVPEGTQVQIVGWAHRVRHQSRISFVVLRDGSGYIQAVFDGETEPFHRETSLAIRGRVKREPKAQVELQPPYELIVDEYAIIGNSDGSIENVITAESSADKLLDDRHLVLRGTYGSTTLKVRHEVIRAFREYFWSTNTYEVSPPTLVNAECEGGSTLFDVIYYGKTAHLTQSSQLYLETCTASLGDVYCILPSYRAEKSKTRRHLSEYSHLEVEYSVCDFDLFLSKLEDMIVEAFNRTIERVGHLVAFMNPGELVSPEANPHDPKSWKFAPKKPFRRLKYGDAIKFCNDNGILNSETNAPFQFGEDITDQPERAMVALLGEMVFMTHFPAVMKSFYMARDPEDPTLTESVDVLAPGIGEIVGGSMRMWNHEELIEAYKRKNLDPSVYYWYTDQRKYGSTPHGGFGLGLERFLVWLLNLDSVREACLYPRYMGRCEP